MNKINLTNEAFLRIWDLYCTLSVKKIFSLSCIYSIELNVVGVLLKSIY